MARCGDGIRLSYKIVYVPYDVGTQRAFRIGKSECAFGFRHWHVVTPSEQLRDLLIAHQKTLRTRKGGHGTGQIKQSLYDVLEP